MSFCDLEARVVGASGGGWHGRHHVLQTLLVALGALLVTVCTFAGGVEAARAEESPYPPGITGLPDGRVYEEVTPAFKNGNAYDVGAGITFGLAAANGEAVVYPMSGAVGEATSGMVTDFVSRRTPGVGWQTSSTTPRAKGQVNLFDAPLTLVPSSDFKRFLFRSIAPFVEGDPHLTGSGVNVFLSEDPFVEPAWLARPQISEPFPETGKIEYTFYAVAGASPSLDTVYFTYGGTLIPEDASRAPHVAGLTNSADGVDPWGFYESSDGQLVTAGTLPNGQMNPFGAVPAAIAGERPFSRSGTQTETYDNEVSADGTRAFFVSPDPYASTVANPGECAARPPCSGEPPELYARQPSAGGAKVSVLVSQSQLPGHEGEPAPHGVEEIAHPRLVESEGSYAFASPDGSHVFFASTDRLTSAAPEDSSVKYYDYDLESGALTYLPAVNGPIVTSSRDGSQLVFENRAGSPWTLEMWHEGPAGGTAGVITELPGGSVNVSSPHLSSDGSVFVFRTNAAIPGGFNHGSGLEQVYRYQASPASIDCLSCPPAGVTPVGNARMSYNNNEEEKSNGLDATPTSTIESRGMSTDGSRVFFDTPTPLVARDGNGLRDVYEWENGHVYLITSGISAEQSQVLDTSESGDDVFFVTSSELVPGDSDEAYDVYDARVPRPGDNPPPTATPCKGSVCQGPPSVPNLLSAPASASFSGVGNLVPTPEATPKRKPASKGKPHKKKHKKRKKGSHRGKGARHGSTAGGRASAGKANGHGRNGRGK